MGLMKKFRKVVGDYEENRLAAIERKNKMLKRRASAEIERAGYEKQIAEAKRQKAEAFKTRIGSFESAIMGDKKKQKKQNDDRWGFY